MARYKDKNNYNCQPMFFQQILTKQVMNKTRNFLPMNAFIKVLQKKIEKKQ